MAHYAQIDQNNIVIQVVVAESQEWLETRLGGTWIQTSYNTYAGQHSLGGIPLRKNYAGIGMIYDPILDAFYSPQPYNSWVLNTETCIWEPPKPQPEGNYYWDEDLLNWVKI